MDLASVLRFVHSLPTMVSDEKKYVEMLLTQAHSKLTPEQVKALAPSASGAAPPAGGDRAAAYDRAKAAQAVKK